MRRAIAAWRRNPDIEILGNPRAERLSIVSFVVRRPDGPLPAPQLRRRAAQRPVRHPGPRRLLVRRPVRPPAARHRPRALARVRARDRARLRGDQAGLGAGQLQLLHQRGGLRSTSSTRCDLVATDGWRLLPDYRLRPGDRPVAAPGRAGRAAADAARRALRGRRHALHRAPPPRARDAPGRLPGRGAADLRGPVAGHGKPRATRRRCRLRAPALVLAPGGDRRRDVTLAGSACGPGNGLIGSPARSDEVPTGCLGPGPLRRATLARKALPQARRTRGRRRIGPNVGGVASTDFDTFDISAGSRACHRGEAAHLPFREEPLPPSLLAARLSSAPT